MDGSDSLLASDSAVNHNLQPLHRLLFCLSGIVIRQSVDFSGTRPVIHSSVANTSNLFKQNDPNPDKYRYRQEGTIDISVAINYVPNDDIQIYQSDVGLVDLILAFISDTGPGILMD